MDTGSLNDVARKLGFARSRKSVLIGMAVFLVLAAVAVAHVLSGAAAASEFQIESSEEAYDSSAEPTEIHELYVHVSGEVNEPGLYELEKGSRVADAVNLAGGFTEEADENACNLARIIGDGEHIVIPSIEETSYALVQGADDGGSAQELSPIVNINTATAVQLESLPGIGSATAQKIIADREANGPYGSADDLTRVPGIGQKKLEALVGLICV